MKISQLLDHSEEYQGGSLLWHSSYALLLLTEFSIFGPNSPTRHLVYVSVIACSQHQHNSLVRTVTVLTRVLESAEHNPAFPLRNRYLGKTTSSRTAAGRPNPNPGESNSREQRAPQLLQQATMLSSRNSLLSAGQCCRRSSLGSDKVGWKKGLRILWIMLCCWPPNLTCQRLCCSHSLPGLTSLWESVLGRK